MNLSSANAFNLVKANFLSSSRELTLSKAKKKTFGFFQTEGVPEDNFKFNKNCEKFSIRVENTVGKREIVRHKKVLLFPQCFQTTCTSEK